jgi:hypothetical protein
MGLKNTKKIQSESTNLTAEQKIGGLWLWKELRLRITLPATS